MSETGPILVVGASRGTGLLAARLLQREGQRVRALARDPARATARLGAEVEVVAGDIRRTDTLPDAVVGARHIIFTAGVRSGQLARQPQVRATDYQGVLNTLMAARRTGFDGRFVYMTSLGVGTPSVSARLLNYWKGNTLVWRRRVEDELRASGVDYAIVRAGFLLNGRGGRRAVDVTQGALPLAPRYHIARADVAAALVAAVEHPRASRVTFEIAWGRERRQTDWSTLLAGLRPDA